MLHALHKFIAYALGFHILSSEAASITASLLLPPQISDLNLTTYNATNNHRTQCNLPSQSLLPPIIPRTCRAALNGLLTRRDINDPRTFTQYHTPIVLASLVGCEIILYHPQYRASVVVTRRLIVACAWWVLWNCEQWEMGGWTDLQGHEGWTVVVQGSVRRDLNGKIAGLRDEG